MPCDLAHREINAHVWGRPCAFVALPGIWRLLQLEVSALRLPLGIDSRPRGRRLRTASSFPASALFVDSPVTRVIQPRVPPEDFVQNVCLGSGSLPDLLRGKADGIGFLEALFFLDWTDVTRRAWCGG